MNSKIVVITTGGTIGSILQSGAVSVDLSANKIAKEIELAKQTLGYDIEVISPINKNSEALAPSDWLDILLCIQKACATDASGIVVTHGTDTLAYTVSAAVALGHLWNKKICFTGAFYSPDNPSSDTSLSLLAALEFAASSHLKSGVFVAFRSNENNSEARILNGFDVKPMSFDDSYFGALYNNVLASYSPKYGLSDPISSKDITYPKIETTSLPDKKAIEAAQAKICCITLYPGIDKSVLQAITMGRDIVIIQLYHSGTGPYGANYNDLIEHLREHADKTLFLLASFPSEYIQTPYDSSRALIDAGGCIYKDVQSHFLYVFSLLSLALGNTNEQIKRQLADWQMG